MGFLMAPLEQNRDNKYALDLSTLQGQKDVVYFHKIFVFHVWTWIIPFVDFIHMELTWFYSISH